MPIVAKPTEQEEKARAQEVAKLLKQVQDHYAGTDNPPSLKDILATIQGHDETLKAINTKEILEKLEKLTAGQEKLAKQIKSSKRGPHYISGVEDEGERFSMLNYCKGVKTRWDDQRFREKTAGLEYEVYKQIQAKAQNTEDYGAGGAFIPDQVIPDVIPAIYARSAFINLDGEGETNISVLEGLIGGDVKIPKFDGGLVAYWIGEEDDYALSQIKTSDVTLKRHKLGVLAKLTDEMMKFASFGFEALFRRDMVRAAAEKLDYTMAFGTGGDHSPRGLSRMDGIKVYKSGDADPLTYTAALAATFNGAAHTPDDIEKMKLFLEEDKIVLDPNAPIISSPRYFAELKKLKVENYSGQTAGNPYLLGIPMSDARLADALGMRIVKGVQIPSNGVPGLGIFPGGNSNAKHTGVFLGNMREFILGRWTGIEVVTDNGIGTGMVSDHELVKLRLHAGTVGRQLRSIVFCPDAKVRA